MIITLDRQERTVLEEGGLDAAEGEDGHVGGLPQLHRAGVDSWREVVRENAIFCIRGHKIIPADVALKVCLDGAAGRDVLSED